MADGERGTAVAVLLGGRGEERAAAVPLHDGGGHAAAGGAGHGEEDVLPDLLADRVAGEVDASRGHLKEGKLKLVSKKRS